ncbi:fibroin heavy chain-like isoform X1 [Lates japonicus]|uniref:Fibroin heavy chain-like isoform X1 n=1 Tax=Lates japonicus TaxID=270547 RepID=A0AAD3M7L4_LATJO|nr:fibroin heavy chain-like isoform X1 [Lates japonicus]
MLVRALLQTSLVLWLAQQTLQGGVKPQSVSWGRVLPARVVGVGVKPGVTGALGALGSRYGSKAMKTGIGRYPGAQLGVGGYRSLGLGGRAGLKQGGYGTQVPYGASLGTGMPLGTGLTNGVGLGLGHGGKRVYGTGLGTLPGYGSLAGIGYPGARPGIGLGYPTGQRAEELKPGVSAADLGGPELASLGQAVRDLKREKSRALGPLSGKRDRTLGPETPVGRGSILGPTGAELQTGGEVKGLDHVVQSSSLGSTTSLHTQSRNLGLAVSQAQGGESYEPTVLKRKSTTSHGATLAAGGGRQQLPLKKDNTRHLSSASSQVQSARDYESSVRQNQRAPDCGPIRDLSDVLEISHDEVLGSETQRSQSVVAQPHLGKDSRHLGRTTPQTQGEQTYTLPLPQTRDVRGNIFSLPKGQGSRNYLSAVADRQGVRDLGLVTKDANGLRSRGTVAVENHGHGSLNLQVQARGSYGPVIPHASGTQSLGIASVEGQKAKGLTADGQRAAHLYHAEHDVKEPKALSIPGQTDRNNQATRYIGGAGNYLGANLGPGGYGAGLGQGPYLGGAAGKLGAAAAHGQGAYPQGVVGKSTGYGEGATGYLGAAAGNGYGGDGSRALSTGYGNGYSDGYGAALSTGGYTGQVQGAFGALGAGLESTGGKYGGAAKVPYGNAPVIPTGLEGEGGYPYAAQHLSLSAEGAKTSNKYGAGAGYGAQQTGYGAQLGATQDALGEQAGKYGGVNGALGNGYKG